MGVQYLSDLGIVPPRVRGARLQYFWRTQDQYESYYSLVYCGSDITFSKAKKQLLREYLCEQERYVDNTSMEIIRQVFKKLLTPAEQDACDSDRELLYKTVNTALNDERVLVRGVLILNP